MRARHSEKLIVLEKIAAFASLCNLEREREAAVCSEGGREVGGQWREGQENSVVGRPKQLSGSATGPLPTAHPQAPGYN